ncbi:MAG: hypothetical protein GF346_09365, partial [Candidatus Eisenbacteria bacterium]|nr:hypothetical protein [Candidatus Latescibacterota bacterium]MBD3302640.1 hypothetical protein [Candidatus Eisenbacteria bacterium]
MKRSGRQKQALPSPPANGRAVSRLDRRSWRNWYLFVAVALVTTLGLGIAILTLLRDRIQTPWPWVNTDWILIPGLAITVLLFAGYLTQQQRQVVSLRRELWKANEEAAKRMRSYYDRLVALLNVSRVLATETDPQTVFESITKTCRTTFACEQSSLMLFNERSQELEVRSVSGHDVAARELATAQKLGRGIAGWVAKERKPFVLGRDLGAPG